jgi:hypothetical protein
MTLLIVDVYGRCNIASGFGLSKLCRLAERFGLPYPACLFVRLFVHCLIASSCTGSTKRKGHLYLVYTTAHTRYSRADVHCPLRIITRPHTSVLKDGLLRQA